MINWHPLVSCKLTFHKSQINCYRAGFGLTDRQTTPAKMIAPISKEQLISNERMKCNQGNGILRNNNVQLPRNFAREKLLEKYCQEERIPGKTYSIGISYLAAPFKILNLRSELKKWIYPKTTVLKGYAATLAHSIIWLEFHLECCR